jgi:hypothetical protein
LLITKIITHIKPHPDEFCAIWLVKSFLAPDAEVEYWGYRNTLPDGKTSAELEEGVLLLGIGGGRFDEHANRENGPKEGECTATLVAKAFGFDKDPRFARILEYILLNDTRGIGNGPFELGGIVASLNDRFGDKDPGRVLDTIMDILDAKFKESIDLILAAKEYDEKARVQSIRVNGSFLNIGHITSDNTKIITHARNNGVGVMVQKSSITGNVQVLINYKKKGIQLMDVVAELRRLEAVRRDAPVLSLQDRRKRGPGMGWYFDHRTEVILNGSKTAIEEPTQIPLLTIVATVMQFITQ